MLDKTIYMDLWDIDSDEKLQKLNEDDFKNAHGIVCMYDITDRNSFEQVKKLLNLAMKHTDDNICRVLVGNKSDLDFDLLTGRKVLTKEAK